MIKFIALCMLLFPTLTGAQVDIQMCGTRVSWLENFFTHANDIRAKCIEQAYEANQRKIEAELIELQATQKKLSEELKKVAYNVNFNIIRCDPPAGQPQNPNRTKKCRELIRAENAVISRIDEIMGWKSRPLPPDRATVTNAQVTPPCPSRERLEQIQPVRYFNRKLYETWERCVMMTPENYY